MTPPALWTINYTSVHPHILHCIDLCLYLCFTFIKASQTQYSDFKDSPMQTNPTVELYLNHKALSTVDLHQM